MAEQRGQGHWLSGLREGYAEIGDQRLHYVEAGDGPLLPGLGERAAGCDVAGEAGIEGGEPWAEDAAVGLGEQDGDGASGRGELVAVGAGDPVDDVLAAQ